MHNRQKIKDKIVIWLCIQKEFLILLLKGDEFTLWVTRDTQIFVFSLSLFTIFSNEVGMQHQRKQFHTQELHFDFRGVDALQAQI